MAPDEKHTFSYLAPIPSYEEATSSRPSSSHSNLGASETSDDAERQTLLSTNYNPPTVESARSSVDSLDGLTQDQDEETEIRREMQEMDIDDSSSTQSLSSRFKRFSSLQSLSIKRFLPSLKFPTIDWASMDNNRAVILGRLVGIFIIGALMYVLIASDVIGLSSRRNVYMFKPDVIRGYMQDQIMKSDSIPRTLQRITQFPHIAGTEGNYILGEWIEEEFKAGGLFDVHMERFDVYMNYPTKEGRQVAIVEPGLEWQAELEEINEQTMVYLGHSASGDVTGHLIYANYGDRKDFEELQKKGIELNGAIVLVRDYGTQFDMGLKVKAAEMAGAAGCLIYLDPAEDGVLYPDGHVMPDDGVQRGTVSLRSLVLGDPLSPGYASTPGENVRLEKKDAELTRIPALPISWRDARHLLESIKGKGQKFDGWAGKGDVEYWTGNADSPKVNLRNEQDEVQKQPIYNIVGHIPGMEQRAKKIIVGNHRDAWCSGAAPGSGTTIMLEVIKHFGTLQKEGWLPLRTIEFINWDGSEYNLMGSTEHVESRVQELKNDAIAYINLDVAIGGLDFRAAASPILDKVLQNTLSRIADPATKNSLRETWDNNSESREELSAMSDYAAFQDIAGVPSIDFSFTGSKHPTHSCYDSYEWMATSGDPGWDYHKTIANFLAFTILELSDHALMPLDIGAYTKSLLSYVEQLEKDDNSDAKMDIQPLKAAVSHLEEIANEFQDFDNLWHSQVYATGGFESGPLGLKRYDRNDKLEQFEKTLLDDKGLVNRTQFKHSIFAPEKWNPSKASVFPSIRQWMDLGLINKAQEEVYSVAQIINAAADALVT